MLRAVVTRVKEASVHIDGMLHGKIGTGYLVLLGIAPEDTDADAAHLAEKIIHLRVFSDDAGKMNRALSEVNGAVLVISQFTLFASYKKGNRPSWLRAAKHEISVPLYEYFCNELSNKLGRPVGTGEFGADMKVALVNDGPVTICMDSKAKE